MTGERVRSGDEVRPRQPGPQQQRGLWFDEFRAGQTFVSPGRTITEADVVNFAALSGDWNPMHTDATFARRTPFRQRVAHGMLVESVATGLGVRTGIFDGTIAALTDMVIHWRNPCLIGDTVTLELEVAAVDAQPSRRSGKIHFLAVIRNQDGKVLIDGEWWTLMNRDRSRDATPGANDGNQQGTEA
ncbi:MAG: MaoC/PaaZ C-terminal domain-containing protein [Planctomycetota bacterium]